MSDFALITAQWLPGLGSFSSNRVISLRSTRQIAPSGFGRMRYMSPGDDPKTPDYVVYTRRNTEKLVVLDALNKLVDIFPQLLTRLLENDLCVKPPHRVSQSNKLQKIF
mmetsp:Transcript_13499/g.27585  ORF Transcript_13499/g.27585 Transcript_13499/m.27585 type:complete len:109 (+) Transcript_13499:975-1301(+)